MKTEEEKERILELFKRYKSLRTVSRLCNSSPNTVDKYVSKKFKVERKNIVNDFKNDKKLIGVYVGLWMGDGTQYRDKDYTVKICTNKEDRILNEFMQEIVFKLFNKKSSLIFIKDTKQAYIKFRSKFIYKFIDKFASYEKEHKTSTVSLKYPIEQYSIDLLKGVFLGLMLTDGYLKKRLYFNVISEKLAKDMQNILRRLNLKSNIYIHKRKKYGWKDLYMVRLNVKDSKKAERELTTTLETMNFQISFKELKYGKNGPAEI